MAKTPTPVFPIYGTDNADTIAGTLGADLMYGGRGDDTYIVNNAGDFVGENANAGTDTTNSIKSTFTALSTTLKSTLTDRFTLTVLRISGACSSVD